jgi:UDPglucose--hexose-1-phosphate uridylyltransferase
MTDAPRESRFCGKGKQKEKETMTEKNEIRQDKVTKQWVIYAPGRGKRPRSKPQGHPEEIGEPMEIPSYDKDCPFCPGNEKSLSTILLEIPPKIGTWRARVVSNKYPALSPQGDTRRFNTGIYLAMAGYGRHEVVIETPLHNRDLARMTDNEVLGVIETYHRRYCELMKEHENMLILIFRNHGAKAGTSLSHPHSQIVVTGVVPQFIRWRETEAQRHFDEFGKCVYCEILEFEQKDRRRVLFENGSFLAFVPYAAEVPYEIWIVPKRHQADFGDISDLEKSDLASALSSLLARLYTKLSDPDYNFVIMTSARYRAGEPQLHWFVQIRPRLTTRAGFEIGSGISINPSLPEEDADFLNREGG